MVLLLRPLQPDPRPLSSSSSSVMPSRQKQLLFSLSGLLGLSCALTAAVAAGLPLWLRGAVLCRTGAELVNATGPELDKFLGELSYGLWAGQRLKTCGLGGRASRFTCECLSHTHTQSDVSIGESYRWSFIIHTCTHTC